ncbi:hypothetical protein SKAU_G00404500 [Synaphobranchus kaupii]|uniref:Uncharacterized protein n=1 Tax=Synaphobranchus kaupii TaxID=118154 RepID=A0A9Q1E9R2_SYNKA|nr:hypothetical protein SKAU_G00404500 [Synaphobranchus kaupii]
MVEFIIKTVWSGQGQLVGGAIRQGLRAPPVGSRIASACDLRLVVGRRPREGCPGCWSQRQGFVEAAGDCFTNGNGSQLLQSDQMSCLPVAAQYVIFTGQRWARAKIGWDTAEDVDEMAVHFKAQTRGWGLKAWRGAEQSWEQSMWRWIWLRTSGLQRFGRGCFLQPTTITTNRAQQQQHSF